MNHITYVNWVTHHAMNHITYVWQYNSVMDKDVDEKCENMENLQQICCIDRCYNPVCSGDEFYIAFANIGELYYLIPSNVNMIALTSLISRLFLFVVVEKESGGSPLDVLFYGLPQILGVINRC